MFRPLWAEVDLGALRNNLKTIRGFLGRNVKVAAVVKQAAYGHGLIPVIRELSACGVDFFCVGSVEEAVAIREDGFRGAVIVLSSVLDRFAKLFLEYNIIPTVVDLKFARKIDREAERAGKIVPVHVKVDTGMGRLGFHCESAYGFIKKISRMKNVRLEGIYTHFPAADTDPEFTGGQIDIFNKFVMKLEKERIFFKFRHCANSIGMAKYPQSRFNIVRPGLILYGIKSSLEDEISVKPVLSLKAKVIFIKKMKKGMSVGYGRTYTAGKDTRIATVSAGYADGYPWALSNCGRVIIKNELFGLAGRVCMDHIMVDLGGRDDIKVGDEVTLIGRSRDVNIGAQDLAGWAKTIPYEILSRLSLKVPRIYKFATKDKSRPA